MSREAEWAFFTVLSCSDIWTVFKNFMYTTKITSNFYDYKNGDMAAYHGYLELMKHNNKLQYI
jgi:glutamate synthase domain-containing protein 1